MDTCTYSNSSKLIGEDRFLVVRNFPVLAQPDGKPFTVEELRNVLEFKALRLFENFGETMDDGVYMSCLEGHVQKMLFGAPLVYRLLKCVYRGSSYIEDQRIHEVFHTYKTLVSGMLGKFVQVNGIG